VVATSLKSNEQPPLVFLVGFMGAGKSAVGQYLALHKGWSFTDLDRLIEKQEGRIIAAIFQNSGEAAFRKLESEALRELLKAPPSSLPHIVALGGGAYAREENSRMIREAGGVVVFLDAPIEELLRRCRAERGAERPLLQDEAMFRRLYEERKPYYSRAQFHADTSGKAVPEVAREIEQWLKQANVVREE